MLLCVVRNVFLIILFTGRKGKSPEERAGSLQPDLTGQDNSGNECSKSGDGIVTHVIIQSQTQMKAKTQVRLNTARREWECQFNSNH